MSKVTKNNKADKDIIIGNRIKSARINKRLSQKELAKKLDLETGQAITMIENGKRSLNISKLENIAKTLDVSTDYLLGLTDFLKPETHYRAIHELTGLSYRAISTLEKLNRDYSGYLIDTINFLIEQEYPFPIEFGFSLPSDYTKNEFEQAEQEALELYEEYEEKLDKVYSPIISMIHSYFTVEVENEEIHITNNSMKSFIGNDKLAEELLPKTIVSSKELVNNVYLSKIKNQLKRGKNKYLKKKEKQK